MRWLRRARIRIGTRTRDQSGATIVFIAVVLLGLLAMTAFVIDFGRIWQERRELQLGATAAALAVGEDCARDLCNPALGYNERLVAEAYADANATDGAASIFDIELDRDAKKVEVVTATKNTSGGDTLEMLFAKIVGFDRITVGASAAVAWGTPLNAATIPLIISDCEWAKGPPLDPGWPGGGSVTLPDSGEDLSEYDMATIITHKGPFAPEDGCTIQPGLDLPGGFGWLDTSAPCVADVTEGLWIGEDPRNTLPISCNPGSFANLLGEPVLIPYYSLAEGQGTKKGTYKVAGFAGFVIAGYDFGGSYKAGSVSCSPGTFCITGWFVDYVSHGGGTGGLGGTDRGVTVIKLIG